MAPGAGSRDSLGMYREQGGVGHSVLVVALSGRVLGMQVADGRVLWEQELGAPEEVEVLIFGDRIYASNGRNLYVLRYPDGAQLLSLALPGTYLGRATMVIEGDRLFVATRGEISCFALDGGLLWHDGLRGRGVGSIALGFPGNFRQADDIGSQ